MSKTQPAADGCWEALREAYAIADMLGETVEAVVDRTLTTADRRLVLPQQLAMFRAWQSTRITLPTP